VPLLVPQAVGADPMPVAADPIPAAEVGLLKSGVSTAIYHLYIYIYLFSIHTYVLFF
jgi:hypothetical protein